MTKPNMIQQGVIRVLIADDQAIARQGLQVILSVERDIEVVGLARDGQEAVELVEKLQPDLVLMDLKMPRLNGVQATKHIKDKFPTIAILVLTTYDLDDWIANAIRSGANGYLLKDTPPQEIVNAIRGTVQGKSYVDPNIAAKVLQQMQHSPVTHPRLELSEALTERELDVLKLLAKGLSNQEIAEALHLSEGTVRNYLSTLFSKLGVSDRTKAAVLAIQHGLIQLGN
jgi:two-component system, NarL family, response regulator LiaR